MVRHKNGFRKGRARWIPHIPHKMCFVATALIRFGLAVQAKVFECTNGIMAVGNASKRSKDWPPKRFTWKSGTAIPCERGIPVIIR